VHHHMVFQPQTPSSLLISVIRLSGAMSRESKR
jgi:hypothetical protein